MFAALGFACIPKNFRVRSARSRSTGNPPVVFLGKVENSLLGNTALLPHTGGILVTGRIVVAGKYGDGNTVDVQAEVVFACREIRNST